MNWTGTLFPARLGHRPLQETRFLLKDAQENYPAWLETIRAARRHVHFESYIIHEDDTGNMFADALVAKAREGVPVRLLYD